ncbi:MAG: TIGR03915 family putative DNA repair protein [Caldicoprobacterales bacterium]|jgi:probable DNA metabolism protein
MLRYIFDGTFEGLLTCIYEAFYRRQSPDSICCWYQLQEDLISCCTEIRTDQEKADRVLKSIRSKISAKALDHAFHAYLSEIDDIGVWIYRYLKLGWKSGPSVDSCLWEDEVQMVQKAARKTEGECHRMLGLLRFRELQSGIFYAPMGPDHNIVSLLAPHFAKRLSDQPWMIHDVKRDIAAIYDRKDWTIALIRQKKALPLHGDELEFQRMWKQYFKSVAISSRRNLRLQKHFMPSRYWRYLVEKN